jgi:hypothetical protein
MGVGSLEVEAVGEVDLFSVRFYRRRKILDMRR